MGWFDKPSEEELLAKYKKAETEMMVSAREAEGLEATVRQKREDLDTAIATLNSKTITIPKSVASYKATVDSAADRFGTSLGQGAQQVAESTAKLNQTGVTKSTCYQDATPPCKLGKEAYDKAIKRANEVIRAVDLALADMETATREWEKSKGYKLRASEQAKELAATKVEIERNPTVSDTTKARFARAYEAGTKFYNAGKGGFYEQAVAAFDEAMTVADEAKAEAQARQEAIDLVLLRLSNLDQPIKTIEAALGAEPTKPEKITAYARANGKAEYDPSRFRQMWEAIVLEVRDKDYVKARDTLLPELQTAVQTTQEIIAGIGRLETTRAQALKAVEDGIAQVDREAQALLDLLKSPEYTEGLKSFRAIEGRDPEIGDMSGISSLVDSVKTASTTAIANAMTEDAIAQERQDFADTFAYAVEGIGIIRSQARYVSEMQHEMGSEKAEAKARAAFEGLRDKTVPLLRDLDLWDHPNFPTLSKRFEATVADTPRKITWTKGLELLEPMAERIAEAHEEKKVALAQLVADAHAKVQELEQGYKQVYDLVHKTFTWGNASGNEILARLDEDMARLRLLDDGSPLGALGIQAMAFDVETELVRLMTTPADDYKALDGLKSQVNTALKTKALTELQADKATALRTEFDTLVWPETRKQQLEEAQKAVSDFKIKVDAAVAHATDIQSARNEAITKAKEWKTTLKDLEKQVKRATERDDDPVKTLKGPFVTTLTLLQSYIDQKNYPDAATMDFPAKVTAVQKEVDALKAAPGDTTLSVDKAKQKHGEAVTLEKEAAAALIQFQQDADLLKADLDKLQEFLSNDPNGDPGEAKRLKKTLAQTVKMVKDSGEPAVGKPQLVAIGREAEDLRKNPRNLRAPAMEGIKTAGDGWHRGIQGTREKLAQLKQALDGKREQGAPYWDETGLIVQAIEQIDARLDDGAFDTVVQLLRSVKLETEKRRKLKEEGLRTVRAYRKLWDDPTVQRMMLNPFKIRGVFTDVYNALDVMEVELLRFPA